LAEIKSLFVPWAAKISSRLDNPWDRSQLSGSRGENFRADLKRHLDLKTNMIACMLTQIDGNGEQVCAAHILPCTTRKRIADQLSLTLDDLNLPRNGLFLAKNIEIAFDKLQLSFVPKDFLHPGTLKMVIWDESVCDQAIWHNHPNLIGQYEGCSLSLGSHNPYLRALSYQAYMAHATSVNMDDSTRPKEFGSPETPFYKERERLEMNFESVYTSEMRMEREEREEHFDNT
jgi:hypothetical protein